MLAWTNWFPPRFSAIISLSGASPNGSLAALAVTRDSKLTATVTDLITHRVTSTLIQEQNRFAVLPGHLQEINSQ
jgi:hypothetical protein